MWTYKHWMCIHAHEYWVNWSELNEYRVRGREKEIKRVSEKDECHLSRRSVCLLLLLYHYHSFSLYISYIPIHFIFIFTYVSILYMMIVSGIWEGIAEERRRESRTDEQRKSKTQTKRKKEAAEKKSWLKKFVFDQNTHAYVFYTLIYKGGEVYKEKIAQQSYVMTIFKSCCTKILWIDMILIEKKEEKYEFKKWIHGANKAHFTQSMSFKPHYYHFNL